MGKKRGKLGFRKKGEVSNIRVGKWREEAILEEKQRVGFLGKKKRKEKKKRKKRKGFFLGLYFHFFFVFSHLKFDKRDKMCS